MVENLGTLEKSVEDANIWVDELARKMGWADRNRSFQLLRITLHALRDRLTVVETAHLGRQLPTLIRGVFYEGWCPVPAPKDRITKNDLPQCLAEAFSSDPIIDPQKAAQAVLDLLEECFMTGLGSASASDHRQDTGHWRYIH